MATPCSRRSPCERSTHAHSIDGRTLAFPAHFCYAFLGFGHPFPGADGGIGPKYFRIPGELVAGDFLHCLERVLMKTYTGYLDESRGCRCWL